MNISVIIPVYNAAAFVKEAVLSALILPQTDEVILVEDGSTDNSLDICRSLTEQYSKVILYQHEGGVNKGAGASRNMGVEKAKNHYVAFLDADDYYLPKRFERAVAYLKEHPSVDGVAEAIGAIYEDEEGKEKFLNHLRLSHNTSQDLIITGMTVEAEGFELFEHLLIGKKGHFSLDGLVLRTTCAVEQKFDTSFQVGQDSHFIQRITYRYNIKSYRRDQIVAIRRIHKGNRWNKSLKQQLLYSAKNVQELYGFLDIHKLSKNAVRKLVYVYVRSRYLGYYQTDNYAIKLSYGIRAYCYLAFTNPALLVKAYL